MLIRLDDPSSVDDLCAHFRRAGFAADLAGGSMVEVDRLDAPSRVQAENEVRVHLQLWRIINPGLGVETVPQ
jgi:hypothetical protein